MVTTSAAAVEGTPYLFSNLRKKSTKTNLIHHMAAGKKKNGFLNSTHLSKTKRNKLALKLGKLKLAWKNYFKPLMFFFPAFLRNCWKVKSKAFLVLEKYEKNPSQLDEKTHLFGLPVVDLMDLMVMWNPMEIKIHEYHPVLNMPNIYWCIYIYTDIWNI